MKRSRIAAGLLLATTLATPAYAQQGGEGAERFAREVFATYSDTGDGVMGDAALMRYWAPATGALIRQDRALATGDPPFLDADPICQCQDWENLTVTAVEISQIDGYRYIVRRADVWFTNGGQPMQTTLVLGGGPGHWRIEDVLKFSDEGSLAEVLRASNARIEAGQRAPEPDPLRWNRFAMTSIR